MDCEKILREIEMKEKFMEMRMKSMKKIWGEFWYDECVENSGSMDEYIPEQYKEKFDTWIKRKGKSRYKYAMFTINFREGVEVEMMLKKLKKCGMKKWIVQGLYCLETRGLNDDQTYKGIHAHMQVEIKDGKRSYECKREVWNTFKHLVGNRNHVNVRYSNRINAFVDYVKGIKDDNVKENHDTDIQFWEDLNLEAWYMIEK